MDDDRAIPDHYVAEVADFYETHARWLFGHACLRTSLDRELVASRDLAADLVQDTFEAAALDWETVRGLAPAQQRAWLRTTLSRKETSNFRRRAAFRRKRPELHRKYQGAEANTEQQALCALALERQPRSSKTCQAGRRKSR